MVEGGDGESGYESYAEDWKKAESYPPKFDMDRNIGFIVFLTSYSVFSPDF